MESSTLLHNFLHCKVCGQTISVERSLHCRLGIDDSIQSGKKNAIKQVLEMTNIFSHESQLLETMFQQNVLYHLCTIIFLQDILEVIIKIGKTCFAYLKQYIYSTSQKFGNITILLIISHHIRMTLKTGVMRLKIQLCITEMNYILKYINI